MPVEHGISSVNPEVSNLWGALSYGGANLLADCHFECNFTKKSQICVKKYKSRGRNNINPFLSASYPQVTINFFLNI